MKLKPGRIILVVLLLFLAAWGIRSFVQYRSPPQLTVQVGQRVPAQELFELTVHSSKAVLMSLSSDGIELDNSGSDWSVHLPASEGEQLLELTVLDRAGNRLTQQYTVTGVAAPAVTLQASQELREGDALAAYLQVDPGAGSVQSRELSLAGRPLELIGFRAGHAAFAAIPFGAAGEELTLRAVVTDEFGRQTVRELNWVVRPIERAVELLQLSEETLQFMSAENQAAQAQRLEEALRDSEAEPLWTEPFLTPAEGWASSGYGDPRQYEAGGEVSHHLGADFAAPTGTPVHATNDGVVVLAEQLPVAGNTVVIDHGAGISSRYYHLSVIDVSVGAGVRRGDLIAEMGSTGLSTGPHLHWEMRIGADPSNPLPWAGQLLPGIDVLQD